MAKNTKLDNLRKQIYESMLPKETDELLEIWRKATVKNGQKLLLMLLKKYYLTDLEKFL